MSGPCAAFKNVASISPTVGSGVCSRKNALPSHPSLCAMASIADAT
jgi:hypothetical protein